MIRALLFVTATLLFLTTAPAHAIPTCVAGSMADYLALTNGCRSGAITVSNFSYSGSVERLIGPGFETGVFDVPASDVFVSPSLPFGASSLRLTFDGGWTDFHISYEAEADGPWIRQFNLRCVLCGGPGSMHVSGGGVPGDFLHVSIDLSPLGPIEHLFDSRSFDPISATAISVGGSSASQPFGGIGTVTFDVVTPEPAALLLWLAGVSGLGLARWCRFRKHDLTRP